MRGFTDATMGTSSQYMGRVQRDWSPSQMSGPIASCSFALHRIGNLLYADCFGQFASSSRGTLSQRAPRDAFICQGG